ncbi:DUF302 domain-containing protein [Adhaeretor mobilis]|uniref:DUF302 domain-containing protein n=1 Tax=Adhaeretor mobilis TaxID=1930276 RepID=A0A517N0T2_9BACT|nr:DUF302 domain-containing protein [Adhaeretor mobilis]QDT00743.1 hypothetical protein HG15A2_40830 [Adhaeretor mobilis]
MFTRTKIALVVVGLTVALGASAFAQSGKKGASTSPKSGPVVVPATGSVEQTVAAVKKMVAGNGMMVMGEINQGKVLAMTGLKLQSETLFVGNPNVGKQLFTVEPGAGLVVPVRINIYSDHQGRTHVTYIPPSQQLHKFGNAKVDKIGMMLDEKLANMTAMLNR